MQEISNSLRQRLGARPQPQTHPDPDTLSAYVEQVLSPAERVRIIEHLADCRDCREVVALSLPQLEPEQPVLQAAPRSRWWAPAYRWATLAATIAVATTLIVERPWQKQSQPTPARQEQAAASSGKTESANASANQPAGPAAVTEPATRSTAATTASKTPAPPVTEDDRALQATSRAQRGQNTPESSPSPRPARPAIVGGAVGGVPAGTRGLADQHAVAPAALMANPAAAPPPPPKVTVGELRNSDAANVNGAGSKETVEVTADTVLPVAPQPQPVTQGAAGVRKLTPPSLSATNTDNRFATEIVPPNVTSTTPPPSPADNSLARMRNFGDKKGKSKLRTAESKVAEAAKTVYEAANPVKPPSAAQGFAGATVAAPHREDAETQSEFRRPPSQALHWRITPDGKLINSTDFNKWHEVNTQTPDIQFRVVVTEGRQVWAGGSNATLIHSWDGGVQWDTMKVPDAGDITQITIDDGWQVKTSNGQTFVSTDHGQTWVPLEQPK